MAANTHMKHKLTSIVVTALHLWKRQVSCTKCNSSSLPSDQHRCDRAASVETASVMYQTQQQQLTLLTGGGPADAVADLVTAGAVRRGLTSVSAGSAMQQAHTQGSNDSMEIGYVNAAECPPSVASSRKHAAMRGRAQ
jgi:translation elongation factor EF-Tu-like GTPase